MIPNEKLKQILTDAMEKGAKAERSRIREMVKGMLLQCENSQVERGLYNLAIDGVIMAIDGAAETGEKP